MKTLEDYMAMSYRMEIVEDKDEGGFVALYPDLPGCITCGETIDEIMENIVDAKRAWLEAMLEDGGEIYEPDNPEDKSEILRLRVPQNLYESLLGHSHTEGMSLKQYCIRLLSQDMYSK